MKRRYISFPFVKHRLRLQASPDEVMHTLKERIADDEHLECREENRSTLTSWFSLEEYEEEIRGYVRVHAEENLQGAVVTFTPHVCSEYKMLVLYFLFLGVFPVVCIRGIIIDWHAQATIMNLLGSLSFLLVYSAVLLAGVVFAYRAMFPVMQIQKRMIRWITPARETWEDAPPSRVKTEMRGDTLVISVPVSFIDDEGIGGQYVLSGFLIFWEVMLTIFMIAAFVEADPCFNFCILDILLGFPVFLYFYQYKYFRKWWNIKGFIHADRQVMRISFWKGGNELEFALGKLKYIYVSDLPSLGVMYGRKNAEEHFFANHPEHELREICDRLIEYYNLPRGRDD